MIKFVIMKREFICGDYETSILDAATTEPPIDGAVLETYTAVQTCHPACVKNIEQEARINDEGKPYIHTDVTVTTEPSYEEWCKLGTAHTRVLERESEGYEFWKFTRQMPETAWVFTMENLEQLEDFLDTEYGIGALWTSIGDIRYYIEI